MAAAIGITLDMTKSSALTTNRFAQVTRFLMSTIAGDR